MWTFWAVAISPAMRESDASNWQSAACTITEIDYKQEYGTFDTNKLTIKYNFNVDGKGYQGSRFSFGNIPKEQKKIAGLKKDSKSFCYYDPADPAQSVMRRGSPINAADAGVLAFLILVFSCPLAALVVGFKPRRKRSLLEVEPAGKLLTKSESNPTSQKSKERERFKALDPENVHWALFLISAAGTLILWGVTLGNVGMELSRPDVTWLGALGILAVGSPFLVAAGGATWFSLYVLAALLNPTLEIAVAKHPVALGSETTLVWKADGKSNWIKHLKFELRGAQSYDESEEVFEILPFYETSKPSEIESGSTNLRIPELTMHSLNDDQALHPNDLLIHRCDHKISWLVVVTGTIPRWPNLYLTFPVTITAPKLPKSNQITARGKKPVPPTKSGATT